MNIINAAVISADGKYRYRLTRRWSIFDEPDLIFCMLNPSTADAEQDDPTIRRCIGFANRELAGGIIIVNLMAYRATDPAEALLQPDPCGPENDHYLHHAVIATGSVICAWGTYAPQHIVERALFIFRQTDAKTLCLGTTKNGHPRHPLYLPKEQPLIEWRSA